MTSMQAFSDEIDNLDEAVRELELQIDKSKLLKNSAAIVFCGYEVDVEELTEHLKETFDFPFIGCTGLGLLSTEGFSQDSILMTVFTADDCVFETGITEDIQTREQLINIEKKYMQMAEKTGNKGDIIFAYTPWRKDMMTSNVVMTLDKASEGVPVFGGVASDLWTFDKCRVFSNEGVSENAVVLMIVHGNIRPMFAVKHSTQELDKSDKIVTKSNGTFVYAIDNKPATEYLKEIGILNTKKAVFVDYLTSLFVTTMSKPDDDDEIDVLRALDQINHEDGTCRFLGDIEEGSVINRILYSKKDIESSAKVTFDEILDIIEQSEDYKYSTILCSSCGARYSLIVSDKNTEAKAYMNRVPEGVNVHGFYSFGEYCPAKGKKHGKLYNVLNNETLAVVII